MAYALVVLPTAAAGECRLPDTKASGQARREITADDLARLRDIGSPDSSLADMPSPLALAPDGHHVAFVVSQGDPSTNKVCRWLVSLDMGQRHPPHILDQGGEPMGFEGSVRGLRVELGLAVGVTPGWSPDGRRLAYLRRDNGVTQLWLATAAGDTAAPVTQKAADVERWAWLSNDLVAFESREGSLIQRTAIEAEGRRGWLYDARFAPQVAPRPQLSGELPLVPEVIDVRRSIVRQATAGEREVLKARGIGGDDPASAVGPFGTFSVRADAQTPFSPGILHFLGRNGRDTRCAASTCSGGIVRVYPDPEQSGATYMRREGWASSVTAFYHWQPGDPTPRRLSQTSDVLLGCIPFSAQFLCLRETSTRPRHLAMVDPLTSRATPLYDPNPEFRALRLGSVRRLTWSNERGLPAWGDLVLPTGYRRGNRLPLIVVQYHSDGFLRGGTGDEYPIYPLAARGFAVLSLEAPAPMTQALPGMNSWDDVRRAGLHDWAERRSLLSSIETGVRLAVARFGIDPRRIGITGLSDGASSARFALVNSHLFSAAAISASSLEPKTMMTYGGIAWADTNRRAGYPLASEDAVGFWQPASIALNARTINVPLLIQASDDEYLLALETFTALREQGKPVEMYVFPGEHHVKFQPAHRLAIYQRAIDWFAFWLQDRVDPSPLKAEQYERWQDMRTRRAAVHSPTSP